MDFFQFISFSKTKKNVYFSLSVLFFVSLITSSSIIRVIGTIVIIIVVITIVVIVVVVVIVLIIILIIVWFILVKIIISWSISLALIIVTIIILLLLRLLLEISSVVELVLVILGWVGIIESWILLEHLLLLLRSHEHLGLHTVHSLWILLEHRLVSTLEISLRLLVNLHTLRLDLAHTSHISQILFSKIHISEIIENCIWVIKIVKYFNHLLSSLLPINWCTILRSDNWIILYILQVIKMFIRNILDKKPLNFKETLPSSVLPPKLK